MTDTKLSDDQIKEMERMSAKFDNIMNNLPMLLNQTKYSRIDFGKKEDYYSHVDEWDYDDDDVLSLCFWSQMGDHSCKVTIHQDALRRFIVDYVGSLSDKKDIEELIEAIWQKDEMIRKKQNKNDNL